MNDDRYPAKYALIYTSLILGILLVPLFFYAIYMKNIHSVQNELLLKNKSLLIIKSMQEYNQNEEYFEYPRFKTFESGLYDKNFKAIFSLLENEIHYFKRGYHLDGDSAFYIVKLPRYRYFDASYLIVKNKLSYAEVYEKIMIILFSILVLVFVLSISLLKMFAKPFKQLNQTLDHFIKDSIHEINTPLSIINVNIDLYNRKNETNKYMQRMKAATKVLSNIYNDMDYLIKHERLYYEKENINLCEYLQARIDYFCEVANMKKIHINLDIQNTYIVNMNPKQLERVIDNNISNAIKYSHENSSIDISLYIKNSKCCLRFEDYGVGIKDISSIFTRYYREDTNKGGFGIGLNIVKSIIDKENIELQISSIPNTGSTFLYIFPLISTKDI